MEKKIQELTKRFINSTSNAEIEAIDREMKVLAETNQSGFEDAMLSAIKETNKNAEDIVIRQKLKGKLVFSYKNKMAISPG